VPFEGYVDPLADDQNDGRDYELRLLIQTDSPPAKQGGPEKRRLQLLPEAPEVMPKTRSEESF